MTRRIISATQIQTYLMCPLKYRFRYLDHVPPAWKSSNLAFGAAVHSALAWYWEEKIQQARKPDIEEVLRIFRADWNAQAEEKIRFSGKADAATIVPQGEELLRLFLAECGEMPVTQVEVPFTVDLVDPETSEDVGLSLHGYLDLLLADGGLVEMKTAKSVYDGATLARHLQLTAYAYAFEIVYGQAPRFLILFLLKHKKPRVETAEVTRTIAERSWFVHIARAVADGIERDVFPPNPGWMCGDCEYKETCAGWRGRTVLSTAPITRAVLDGSDARTYSGNVR